MSARDIGGVRALTFDVGGTVFDWQTATREAVGRLAEERGADIDVPAFCLEWRRQMFGRLARVRRGDLPWRNADALHEEVLEPLGEAHPGLRLSADDRRELADVWHRMRAWPDFGAALPRLRERYTVVVLTVLSWSIVVDCNRLNGLSWDGVLSCEFLGTYKPDPGAYEAAARLLRHEPGRMMMVAAHPGDLRAAMAVGYRTAFVAPRLDEPGGTDHGDPGDFDIRARDFTDLADQLTA